MPSMVADMRGSATIMTVARLGLTVVLLGLTALLLGLTILPLGLTVAPARPHGCARGNFPGVPHDSCCANTA